MEKVLEVNRVHLSGRVLTRPEFNHKTYGEAFYMLVLGIFRRSGYEDRIRLIIPEKLLGSRSPKTGDHIDISGQVRTYNREADGRNKLEVTVFVQRIDYCLIDECDYDNQVHIEGFICKNPVRRRSPLGREICDLMIAVNRMYNKSDYIPAIAWGRNAVFSENLQVGDKIGLNGRIQSRDYRKYTEDGHLINKTAYEVSISEIETIIAAT
ncbi:MAG: single-stranded DNA-binding protein [Lentihominibacter sp.]